MLIGIPMDQKLILIKLRWELGKFLTINEMIRIKIRSEWRRINGNTIDSRVAKRWQYIYSLPLIGAIVPETNRRTTNTQWFPSPSARTMSSSEAILSILRNSRVQSQVKCPEGDLNSVQWEKDRWNLKWVTTNRGA